MSTTIAKTVVLAHAGNQPRRIDAHRLGSRLRGNDGLKGNDDSWVRVMSTYPKDVPATDFSIVF